MFIWHYVVLRSRSWFQLLRLDSNNWVDIFVMDKTWSCWRVSAGATETKRLLGASLRMRRCLRAFPTFASLQPRSRQSVRPLLCPGNSHEKPAFQRFLLGEAFVYFSHCRFNQKVLIKTAKSDFITVLIYLSLTCLLTGGKWKCHYSSRYLFICLFICELNVQKVVCIYVLTHIHWGRPASL